MLLKYYTQIYAENTVYTNNIVKYCAILDRIYKFSGKNYYAYVVDAVYMNFPIKNYNVCGITQGRGVPRPPPMFRTIPPEGHPVNGKK